MGELSNPAPWRPARASLAAGALVVVGFALTAVSWWFLLLVALGTFGPGLMRECGILLDQDEFQRRATYRAAYHAFIVAGLAAFLLVAFFRTGRSIEHPQRLATFLLALLWFTWFFSSLLAYWGPRVTSNRVLIAFGSVWLAFAILSNVGQEWSDWTSLLLHTLIAAPFFALAWVAKHWPRVAGLLLLCGAVGVFMLIEYPRIRRAGSVAVVVEGVTLIFLVGPLIGSGVALVSSGGNGGAPGKAA